MGDFDGRSDGRLVRIGVLLGTLGSAFLALVACSLTDPVRTASSSTSSVVAADPIATSPIVATYSDVQASPTVPIIRPPANIRIVDEGVPIRKVKGTYKVGPPYTINGETYVPTPDPKYRAEGIASWYGPDFHGKETANGEIYDMHGISAAHRTMPMPSYARVTNLENGRSIVVRVNDRGPFIGERVIDLSVGTAKALGTYAKGLVPVRVEYVGRAPLQGADDRLLLATLREGKPAPPPSLVMLASAKPAVVAANAGNPRSAADNRNESRKGNSSAVGGPFVLSSASSRPVPQGATAEVADRRAIGWSPADSLGVTRGLY